MKKKPLVVSFFLLSAALGFFAFFVMAQEYMAYKATKEEVAPPGMEIVKIGQVNFIVPKGTHFYKKDGLIILEGIGEYAARRFLDIEKRLIGLEEKINKLNEGLGQINETLLNKGLLPE